MDNKRKATPTGRIYFRNILKNWAHQAITYMDNGEIILRTTIEIFQILGLWWTMSAMGVVGMDSWIAFILTFALVHTFNWVTNGNFWALMLFTLPFLINRGDHETCVYLNDMATRLTSSKSITGLALFGSASRNEWHDRSDVDIRILRGPGIINLIKAVFLTMRERILATLARQPLDLFLADDIDFLKKMRPDEKPIFLLKRDQQLEENYPNAPQVTLLALRDLKVEVQRRLQTNATEWQ